ncbi:enoyl-CoA hydratase/isomerase family protein [Photobacterium sanctipauli]|uniref:3-hydroxyisobutyryl-CoA hydrolase n=1 Tax=Photobacterium sanctipauli TaxID=1342794 RepID=A0A2T3NVJ3_9GAMM|nr:enoyl-CoA hydratase/isomerase family protein [Photobacterium sanctipauli]PSW20296.1 enoyl-CoA hydratase/isomerase family protein [Photobacterium sanctipauli]
MEANVNISELASQQDYKVGVAELNNPASLNALTLDMLSQLNEALMHWQHDDSIACVVIHGQGGKAFCAGGDVRTMYHVMDEAKRAASASTQASPEHAASQSIAFLTDYFTLEYQTDYLIHTYPKPIIVWGEGIVMGGGIGLYVGASHRVTTPSSRLAMPEISIGLYPDVGGTWFLNHLPQGVGLFLGLTGAPVNATDALALSLTEHILLPEHKSLLLNKLQQVDWGELEPQQIVTNVLDSLGQSAMDCHPESQLLPHLTSIQSACQYGSLSEVAKQISTMNGDDKWLTQAKNTLKEGSPISAAICYRQLNDFHYESLADCFRLELTLSVRSGELGEFHEGVRARLIDKTGQPNWLFTSIETIDESVIDQMFTPLWDDYEHPLRELGE